jgi:hypothetical protein
MYTADWIEAFVEIYKMEAAVPLIIFCVLALLKIRKMNRDLLRARLFLNNAIMHRAWIFILIGMTSLALNALVNFVGFLGRYSVIEDTLSNYNIIELTQIVFLTAFSLAMYNCNLFISTQNMSLAHRE